MFVVIALVLVLVWPGDRNRADDPVADIEPWHKRAETVLNQIDPSWVARLHNHAGLTQYSGSFPISFSQGRIHAYDDLGFDLQRLNEFMTELRRR